MIVKSGDLIALTPPLGWNSWNAWGLSVDDEKVRAAADAFVDNGLADHGWTFINIDDGWEAPERLPDGSITGNEKFPDFKNLSDYVHSKGLKLGIYSGPGPMTCGGYLASYQHEYQDAATWAKWGIDYIKYDWCSYRNIAKDNSLEELQKPYILMRKALDAVNRDIVYSLCQYGMGDVWKWGADVGGNLWRTTGDIRDTWASMSGIGFRQDKMSPFASPGHWNNPDMLVVGWVGWGPNLHPTRLTPDEQYTHISLWALLSAPLLIGCDLTRLDDFTLNLLTNDEVLGQDATELFNYLTTGYQLRSYQKLLTSPKALKKALLSKIARECKLHTPENPGLIQFKMNALEDIDITRALYEATRAGVKVDLIIRDTCRLRPGITGLSESARVISIVGRFLEHTRIYYFQNGGDEEYFIGSADCMKRNLESRVEVVTPVEPELLRNDLRQILDTQLNDKRSAWEMQSDGSYTQYQPANENEEIGSQSRMIALAEQRRKNARKAQKTKGKLKVPGRNLR